METFLKMLELNDTYYERIADNEIVIPCIAIAATKEQGEMLPQDEYAHNPLLADEVPIHLTFRDGRIDWAIIWEVEE